MKIIISPAKKMKENTDSLKPEGLPVFLDEAKQLRDRINGFNLEEQKALWACSDRIAAHNSERFKHMEPDKAGTPAILAYDGIQYTYMAPSVFEEGQFDYVEANLRILSGFYGVLKPMDAVVPYRLEMQARLKMDGYKDLYGFWGDRIYKEVRDESGVIINLASAEYSRCVERFLRPEDVFITCVFGEEEKGRIVQKGVYAKMARGSMVRYMAERNISDPEQLKDFSVGGYHFEEELSDRRKYVFIRDNSRDDMDRIK